VYWLLTVLLAASVLAVLGAEWPRLTARLGRPARTRLGRPVRARRERARRKAHLRLVKTETDDFAESVQRDLEKLPTIEERDRKRR
jgi:hypothetical protein